MKELVKKTYLAMIAINGETKRFMYLEAGLYALLNLQRKSGNTLKNRISLKFIEYRFV